MSSTVSVKGVNYTLAADGDKDYGAYMTTLINAMINAYNDTPVQTNVAQYDAVVSSVAARRTHATLEAVIADAGVVAGSNVLIDGDVFTQAATLNISKKLYIYGLGDSGFEAGAGLGATPIIRFSASGSRLQGITLDANALAPSYAIQVDAGVTDIVLDVELVGVFGTNDIDNQSTDEALIGFVKVASGNYLLPISTPGANSELSNLAGTGTAINEDLVYDTNNTYDIGTDALEVKDIYTHSIQHGDAANPNLLISTTSDDGDIDLVPDGTGRVTLDTTIEIESGVIEENTGNLEVIVTGAGSDITVNSDSGDATLSSTAGTTYIDAATGIELDSADDSYTIDISGTAVTIPYKLEIIDFTTVNSPGTASQIQAGNEWTYTDLDSNLSNFTTIASYRFVDAAGLVTDDVGTYDLTNNNAATAADGILGSGHATDVDGTNQYYSQATLLDVIAGLTNGLVIAFWFKTDDGQPGAGQYFFDKDTVASQDQILLYLNTDGRIQLDTEQNNAGNVSNFFSTVLPNGATDWHQIIINWDTTNGIRCWFDGVQEITDSSETTLALDGTATDFIIGASTAPGAYFDGQFGHFIVADAVLNQNDVDYMYASTIPIPASLQGKSFNVIEQVKPQGDATYTRYQEFQEIARSATTIYAQGRQWGSTDSVKLEGMVS